MGAAAGDAQDHLKVTRVAVSQIENRTRVSVVCAGNKGCTDEVAAISRVELKERRGLCGNLQ